MANLIKLDTELGVGIAGSTLHFTAKVVNDKEQAQGNVKIKWTVSPNGYNATLGKEETTTGANGYSENSVTCGSPAALEIKATIDGEPANSAYLELGFSDGTNRLRQPRIPQAKNGVIDSKAAKTKVQVMIYRYSGFLPGDIYTFYWGRSTASQLDDGSSSAFPWIMDINSNFVVEDVLADGTYPVYYTIEDPAGNISYSDPLMITVMGGTYVRPHYDYLYFTDVKYNTINRNTLQEHVGLRVEIPISQGDKAIFPENSRVDIHMKIISSDRDSVIFPEKVVKSIIVPKDFGEKGDVSNQVTLDRELFEDGLKTFNGVRGEFWYVIYKDAKSVSRIGTSKTKSLIIDTVPPHLTKKLESID